VAHFLPLWSFWPTPDFLKKGYKYHTKGRQAHTRPHRHAPYSLLGHVTKRGEPLPDEVGAHPTTHPTAQRGKERMSSARKGRRR
jgi:hypothetical protein